MSNRQTLLRLGLALLISTLLLTFVLIKQNEGEKPPACPVALETVEGASVSLEEGRGGLRFSCRVPKAELDALTEPFVIGILILPTDLLDGALTVENTAAVSLCTESPEAQLIQAEDGFYYFSATLTEMLPRNDTRDFTAVSYIKIGEVYYYADYSAEKHSRSLWETSAAAFADTAVGYSEEQRVILASYLDRVVVLDASLNPVNGVAGYTSPYTVSYENGSLVITPKDGTLVEGDISTVMINGAPYTSGWTISDNCLTAPYALNAD